MKVTKYEMDQVQRIIEHEKREPSVVSQAAGVATAPVSWIIGKVVPPSAVEGALRGANWLAESSIDYSRPKLDPADPLELYDMEAHSALEWAVSYAALEGGCAGWFGLFSLPVDIPFTVTLSLRTIRRIGVSYGYVGQSAVERDFALAVLRMAGANNQGAKAAAIATLRSLEVMLVRTSWKAMAEKATTSQMSKEFAMISMKELAKQLGINLTKRKALAAIPAIGAVSGAAANAFFIGDVARASIKAYQKRWLTDRGRWLEAIRSLPNPATA